MNLQTEYEADDFAKSMAEARQVLAIEAEAVLNLQEKVDHIFSEAMKLIINCRGRVVLTGLGKSGLVAKKMAATFSSTGTPAFFVHAGEASHGDLGMITADDIVIAVSNSGETDEVLSLLPSIRRIGAKVIAFSGNPQSTLGKHADLTLLVTISEEACPHNLAPTASTTATLALGDALAIALSHLKGFTEEDFALYHPGGNLGRKLLTKVKDVLKIRHQNPVVSEGTSVREALFHMTSTRMGSTSIVNHAGKLTGIITDGDIRRLIEKSIDFLDQPVQKYMTEAPVTISAEKLAAEALRIMEEREINDLPVVENGEPVGMLNFQDLLRARIF